MLIHFYTVHTNFKSPFRYYGRPMNPRWQMALSIISAYLDVASIFTQAKRKHLLLNDSFIIHNLINRLEMIWTTWVSLHAQDAICQLRKEIIGFFLHTPKCVLELINAPVCTLSKVHRVPHYIAIIVGTFSISLIKLAFIVFYARRASISLAREHVSVFRSLEMVQAIQMCTTGCLITEFVAGDGGYWTTRIEN